MKEVEKQEYDEMIEEISKFLNGGVEEIKQDLQQKDAAERLPFRFSKMLLFRGKKNVSLHLQTASILILVLL